MSNFRTRLLGLAGAGVVFAGLAFGQAAVISCTAGTNGAAGPSTNYAPNAGAGTANINPTIRAESQTELVADYILGCNNNTGAAVGSITVVATLSIPVTSKAVTGLGIAPGTSEATITVTGGLPVQGVVSGSTITFNGLTAPVGNFTATIQNVRGNASGGGAAQVTESAVLQYPVAPNVSSNVPSAAANVGFITTSLGGPTTSFLTTVNYTACLGNPIVSFPFPVAPTASFIVSFKELFTGALKSQVAENGSFIPAGANAFGIGLASSADQIVLSLANVPASATVYVPQTIAATGTTLSIANSTAATAPAGIVALGFPVVSATPTGGAITITYTVTAAASTGPGTFAVPVFVTFAANSAGQQGPVTANISLGPNGTIASGALPASVPLFLASSFAPASGSTITLCNTTLLFPFVTNQLGFDTGIVLSNTSTDNLGFGGKSVASPQSGICMLNFYGTGAPAAAVPDPMGSAGVMGTTNPNGPVHTFTISNSAVAPGFQGYMIASCPFQYAHGFAFITYNLTQQTGVAEGYIAEVLNNARPVATTTFTGVTPVFNGAGALTGITNNSATTATAEPVTF